MDFGQRGSYLSLLIIRLASRHMLSQACQHWLRGNPDIRRIQLTIRRFVPRSVSLWISGYLSGNPDIRRIQLTICRICQPCMTHSYRASIQLSKCKEKHQVTHQVKQLVVSLDQVTEQVFSKSSPKKLCIMCTKLYGTYTSGIKVKYSRNGSCCTVYFEQNERLRAGSSPDAVAGRKALTFGVKSSRMEESVGNNKRSQA